MSKRQHYGDEWNGVSMLAGLGFFLLVTWPLWAVLWELVLGVLS